MGSLLPLDGWWLKLPEQGKTDLFFILPTVSASCAVTSKKKKKMLTPKMLGLKTCNRFVMLKKIKFGVMRGLFS